MSGPDGVSEGGNDGGQSEAHSDGGVSEETKSSVDEAMSSGGDHDDHGSGPAGGPDDGLTAEDAQDTQERMEAEGRAARESFERRETSVREMERAANEAALDAAVETHEWTAEEQAALDRGTAEGVADAAEGWAADVVDGVKETVTVAAQAGLVAAAGPLNDVAPMVADAGLEAYGPVGKAVDQAAEFVDDVLSSQRESLAAKADALTDQIEAIPEIPDALKDKFEADLALADAMQDAYVAGKADLSVLEESARLRAETVTEMGILAAEVGSLAVGGAGLAVKAVKGMGKLDLDLPGGAIGALNRATDAAKSMVQDLRNFALGETGALDLAPGQKLDRDWFKTMMAGKQFDLDNHHRYDANEITVSYDGNTSGQARVDSLTIEGRDITEIVSRKNTQLADVQLNTAKGYLRELATKYPVGAKLPDTPKNARLGLDGDELAGQQILEVPVQGRPIPQDVLDYARDLDIDIRDIEGRLYK